jgi:hypothetical protein
VLPEQARSPQPLPDGRADARSRGAVASAWARSLFRMILVAGGGPGPAPAATATGIAHPMPAQAVAATCPPNRRPDHAVMAPTTG